jgi:ribosomal protein S8
MKITVGIAEILLEEGFIEECRYTVGTTSSIVIRLKVKRQKDPKSPVFLWRKIQPGMKSVIRVSTPGRRVYCKVKNLWTLRGLSKKSCVIMSTSKGIMTSGKALKENVGGEVLCCIW